MTRTPGEDTAPSVPAAPPSPSPGLNEPYCRIGSAGARAFGRHVHVSRSRSTIIA